MRICKYAFPLILLVGVTSSFPVREVAGVGVKRCPVHHLPLKKERLEIIYGLTADPCLSTQRLKSAAKYFPYANSVVYGGCLIEPDSPKYQDVWYCEKCRAVEKDWPCLEQEPPATGPVISHLP